MNYIYETPWWLPTGIGLLGVILFVTGNNRLEKKLKLAGISVIILAVALALLSFFLDSEREKVIKRTRGLVESVEARDWNRMATYLHPNVTISVFAGRDRVVSATRNAAEYSDLRQARVYSVDTTELPDQTMRATVRVNSTLREGTSLSDWVLEWEKTDAGWVVRTITPEGGPGITGAMLEEYIRNRGR
ncbi:MAG TPA: hypothetical protein VGQ99_17490 [Tepidisphaeraceae bacterium]|jgi:hypothetical protein|nr:hypothetical protein [Tepidisphaeraceae bacterium]